MSSRKKMITHHKKVQGLDKEIKTLVLPNTPGLSEYIDVSSRNLPVRIAFTSSGTLRIALEQIILSIAIVVELV